MTDAEILKADYEGWVEIDDKGNLTVKDFSIPRNIKIYVQATAGTVWSSGELSIVNYEIKALPVIPELVIIEEVEEIIEMPTFKAPLDDINVELTIIDEKFEIKL